MKKRQLETIKRGIARIFIVDQLTGKKSEPTRGAKYRVTCYIPDQNGKTKKVNRFTENYQDALKLRNECGRPEFRHVFASKANINVFTFKELCDEFIKVVLPHRALGTQLKYKSLLKHLSFFNEFPVEKITVTTVDQWLSHITSKDYLHGQHSTRCSYEREFTLLKLILRHYQGRKNRAYVLPFINDQNKMTMVRQKPLKPSKYLTEEQFGEFHKHLRESVRGTKWEALEYVALFQYMLGQRIQETAALHFEDFNTELGIVTLDKKVVWTRRAGFADEIQRGHKADSGKTLPLDEEVLKLLSQYKLRSGRRSGLMFLVDGKMISYRNIQHLYNRALKKAGFNFGGTHFIRITSITNIYNRTKDIKTASLLAGHRSLTTTEGYIKTRNSVVQEALKERNQNFLSQVYIDQQMTAN